MAKSDDPEPTPVDMLKHELANILNRWADEADLSVSEVIGVLELLKMEILFEHLE